MRRVITLTKNENKLSQIAYNDIKCNENKAFWSKTDKSLILQQTGLECGHRNRKHEGNDLRVSKYKDG